MSKGYVVANIRVKDQEKFQQFSGMAGPAIKKYGGKVLARGPDADRLEGNVSGIVMMIEFESKEAALNYAKDKEIDAIVSEPKERKVNIRPRGYGENFATDRKVVWTH